MRVFYYLVTIGVCFVFFFSLGGDLFCLLGLASCYI